MILSRYFPIISSGKITRNPASTIKSGFNSSNFSKNAALNSVLSLYAFGEMQNADIPLFSALFNAYAPALLQITPAIYVFLIVPSAMPSIIACRFVPPPDTQTTILSIRLLPFHRPLFLQHGKLPPLPP